MPVALGDDCSDDADSDADAGRESDDGFDGQCELSTAANSTCSRTNSLRSSRSSEASDDSAATETSQSWWKRRFGSITRRSPANSPKSSKPSKSVSRKSSVRSTRNERLSEDSTASSSTATSTSSSYSAPSSPRTIGSKSVPILTRLRRSVSARAAPRSVTNMTRKHENGKPQSKSSPPSPTPLPLSLENNMPKSTPARSPSGNIFKKQLAPKPAKDVGCNSGESASDVQWTMLKCKGVLNLHVVSVPASASSLNHKDAFLLYPCLYRKLDSKLILSSMSFSLSGDASSSAATLASSVGDGAFDAAAASAHHRASQYGPLLAQEYNRRKSICALASRTIYVWIGTHATAIKRDAIVRVAMEIRDRELLGKANIVVIDESVDSDSARRKFFARLHTIENPSRVPLAEELPMMYNQITPMVKAGDDADFERALGRRKVLYGFWEAVPPATILSVGSDIHASMLSKVPLGGVVVLDTWTDVFIWWRNEPCNPAVRKCAVNFANMLIQDACIPPRPRSASVWHEIHGFEHVIFKTKFPDWPFVFGAPVTSAQTLRPAIPASPSSSSPAAAAAVATSGSAMVPGAVPMRSIVRMSHAVAVA
ncbi:hypothetical protein GGI12_001371 [Dipsacomyces acuminosporus]|nr:hypothetical protein GGI12_001371 [Dipsacomyces acuminosporus]